MPLSQKALIQINQSLFSLTHSYETRMLKESDNSLSLADCSMLLVLNQFAPITAAQLSRTMDINPGTISVYVNNLVRKGLLKREQDPDDRRNWWLMLTDEGKPVAANVVDYAALYTQDFLSTLSEEEQKIFHSLLLKASNGLGYNW